MKAIVFERHGGPEVLELRDLPEPAPGSQDVLIEVKASGVNANGYWARVGVNGRAFPLPMIPGSDAAGIVRAVGDHVNNVKVGDEVVIYCGISCRKCYRCVNGEEHICEQNGGFRIWGFDTGPYQGAHAEWVVINEHNCVPKPKGLTWEEAASFPLTLVTAWHMLVTNARIGANDVGGDTVMESIKALRHGGVIVTCGATSGYQTHVELANLFIQNKGILGSTLGSKAELIQALRCVERGQIKPRVTEVLPLGECAK